MLEILLDIRDLLTTSRVLPLASSIPGSKSDG
jgi:hypothetical protein